MRFSREKGQGAFLSSGPRKRVKEGHVQTLNMKWRLMFSAKVKTGQLGLFYVQPKRAGCDGKIWYQTQSQRKDRQVTVTTILQRIMSGLDWSIGIFSSPPKDQLSIACVDRNQHSTLLSPGLLLPCVSCVWWSRLVGSNRCSDLVTKGLNRFEKA